MIKTSIRATSGAELRAHRKAAGLTQAALAELAGCLRGAVIYWEAKSVVDVRSGLRRRLAELVGLCDSTCSIRMQVSWDRSTRAHVGWGVTQCTAGRELASAARQQREAREYVEVQAKLARLATQRAERAARREAYKSARRQVRCGALTRKGTRCRNWSEPGRRRCKFHGGRSTGPRTPEGRARIAEAQRRRWAAWRAARGDTALLRDWS